MLLCWVTPASEAPRASRRSQQLLRPLVTAARGYQARRCCTHEHAPLCCTSGDPEGAVPGDPEGMSAVRRKGLC